MALIIVIRRIVIAAVLAAFIAASVVTVSASSGPTATKAAHVAVPEYWYGYWPGNSTLCVLDQTNGMPVAEAVAEFDHTVVHLEVREGCGETETIIVYLEHDNGDRWPAVTRTTDGSWDGDLWAMSGIVRIAIDPTKDLTDEQWQIALTHELGHAVGLDHTPRQDSIMNPQPYDLMDGLTETDLTVLAKLYLDQ